MQYVLIITQRSPLSQEKYPESHTIEGWEREDGGRGQGGREGVITLLLQSSPALLITLRKDTGLDGHQV